LCDPAIRVDAADRLPQLIAVTWFGHDDPASGGSARACVADIARLTSRHVCDADDPLPTFHSRCRSVCVARTYAGAVITCVVHYIIDPAQIEAFERFAHEWMRLVAKHGGIHHGYFLPAEGASDRAEALFSSESLAAYERYRFQFGTDPESVAANKIRDDSGCVLRYERTFMRPLLPG
jgi:hypothetical protein